jgi:UDP-glucose 4-epimerase
LTLFPLETDSVQTVEIIEAGYNVVILDNLSNSSMEAVRRIEAIVGKSVAFENVDLTNFDAVKSVFEKYPIDSVIHFAALKVFSLHVARN